MSGKLSGFYSTKNPQSRNIGHLKIKQGCSML
jgi:hypothetical protein